MLNHQLPGMNRIAKIRGLVGSNLSRPMRSAFFDAGQCRRLRGSGRGATLNHGLTPTAICCRRLRGSLLNLLPAS